MVIVGLGRQRRRTNSVLALLVLRQQAANVFLFQTGTCILSPTVHHQLCVCVAFCACRVDVVQPQLPVQQGFWSVSVTAVGLSWANGSTTTPPGTCTGFAGNLAAGSGSISQASSCIGILDSGTAQIIGSIEQVAALNAALGGKPSFQQLPFDCPKLVAAVLGSTAQALMSDNPDTAANQVWWEGLM